MGDIVQFPTPSPWDEPRDPAPRDVTMSDEALLDPKLSYGAKGLYAEIQARHNRAETVFRDGLTNWGRDLDVLRWFDELVARGYISTLGGNA